MNSRLKNAVAEIERLPVEQQEEAAELLKAFAANVGVDDDALGLAVARASLDAHRRGEVASEADMDVLRKPWR